MTRARDVLRRDPVPVRPARATLEGLRIVGLVARGAMSCVYRAQELDTGRPVALKVPRRTAAGSAAALERERAALSLAEFEHAERIHVAEGDTPGAVVARFNRANALFELSDYASAVAVARAAVSEAEDLELNYALGYGRFMLGVFLRRSGERVSWRDELERALASSDDDPRLAGEIAVELALDALERGDPAEARRRIEGAVAALEPAPTQLAQAYAVRSMVALRSGETRAAAQWAERAREIAAPLGLMVDDLTLVRLSLLQVCVATGDARGPGLAREAIAELEERGRRLGDATLVPSFLTRPYNRWLVDAARALGAGSGGRSRDAS